MLKRKRSNKGFTLIEVIIAMSIFSVVIFMGYKVINGFNVAMKNQEVVTKNQMNANLVNKYLTKDLEQCNTFKGPIDTSSGYKFIINEDTNKVEYSVVKSTENKKHYYSLIRNGENSNVEIINKQIFNNEYPFTITPDILNKNIYKVKLDYEESEEMEEYQFDISPRIASTVEDTTKPEIDNGKNSGYIGFEYFNPSKNNINIKITPKGSIGGVEEDLIIDKQATHQGFSNQKEFNIDTKITPGNNNGKLDAHMGSELGSKGNNEKFVQNKEIFGKGLYIDLISIEITDNIEVTDLKIKINDKELNRDNIKSIYKKGSYTFNVNEKEEEQQNEVYISAKMKIIEQNKLGNSSVVIRFGKSKLKLNN